CLSLNKRNTKALAYFILAGSKTTLSHQAQMHVPKDAKCPVCGMFVSKYPKWASSLKIKQETHYFDGIKDMMKFYIFDVDFPYNRKHIKAINVTDFYTLESIDAKTAFYVIGSNVYGPMGNELIAFSTRKASENFKKEHLGKTILRFEAITPTLVMGLDGIVY
ncbi:nitrous oxide reductase accessory protein NosL, partial [Sulfurovum sp.]|uniref:nitrous oxide reductase accessory protein NosL n=1 Tax=Sulfurovum sp. TaxID=1969726 RepID=UPI0028680643